MTAHSCGSKPRYNEVNGPTELADLASCPPFLFREVTSRVFPIRANIGRLYTFCDQYLNLDIPDRLVHFRPSLPYVYMMVINYGSMSAASARAQNFGWVAQREVTFTVPLERWVRDEANGPWRFVDWACVSPFIFVDDALSLSTGREVYGWPKVLAEVSADVPLWATNPRAPTRLFSLRTPIIADLYDGGDEHMRELLQVDRDSVPRFTEIPPDPDNPWNPLSVLAGSARNAFGLMEEAADMLVRAKARGYRHGWDKAALGPMCRVAGRNLLSFLPQQVGGWLQPLLGWNRLDAPDATGLGVDMITLKQFRDTGDPTQACYQAVVSSRMSIDRVNRCGLLGDYNLLRGDPSGGYAIRIHRYAAQPIVDCLGLQVHRSEANGGNTVDILKPTFPFWTDVDLRYGTGETLCWRAQCAHPDAPCTDWQTDAPAPATETTEPAAPRPASDPSTAGKAAKAATGFLLYNTLQGAGTQAVSGPFEFPDLTLQVFPLDADPSTLQEFVNGYLNVPLGSDESHGEHRFEATGTQVYVLVSTLGPKGGGMWSESNDIGWWADKDVSFAIPVKHYQRAAGAASQWALKDTGLVTPFAFANRSRAVISDREINGRSTIYAEIDAAAGSRFTASDDAENLRPLLTVSTDMFPAFFMGQEAERDTLIEICQVSRANETSATPPPEKARRGASTQSGIPLPDWLALAPDPAARSRKSPGRPSLMRYNLKQYRDARQVGRACYQAVTAMPWYVEKGYELVSIEPGVQIRLALTPAYPIARILGLAVQSEEHTGPRLFQVLEPKGAFRLRVHLREELGRTLCWRTHEGRWLPGDPD
ncbi:hypothetical protein ACW73L_12250 [Methylolobus aquaticus]